LKEISIDLKGNLEGLIIEYCDKYNILGEEIRPKQPNVNYGAI